jgi:hypothetical protein
MGKSIQDAGAVATIKSMSVLPLILVFAFIILLFIVKNKKEQTA